MDKQAKRRIGKSILAVGILLAMLVMATGSASADGVCVWGNIDNGEFYQCGQTVTQSCTLNATMTCSSGHGLQVGANGITIDGANYTIDGPGCSDTYIVGIYNNNGYDNIVIKNVEVKNFCDGIRLKGGYDSDSQTCTNKVENNTIDNCTVHDNGVNTLKFHGIHLKPCVCNSTIINCTVYDNTGEVEGSCEDGGMGIRLHTLCDHNNITNNTIYGNRLSGIFSKMKCKYNNVTYNNVTGNGKTSPGNGNMSGGIRLECVLTNYWNVSYNTVTNNTGPGIYVRGDHNNITHNDVTNNNNASSCVVSGTSVDAGDGIYIAYDAGAGGYAQYNNVTYNRFCNNEYYDMYNHTGDATTTYDENICNKSHPDGLCEYDCVDAYKYQIGNNPGLGNPNIEFNTTEYANARVNDDVRACNTTTLDERYAAHRFNFTVREPASKIDKIKVIWNGIGDHDSATDGAKLRIYNFGSAAYEQLGSTTLDTEVTLTGEKTSSISNYINSDNVTVLVNQTSAHSRQGASHICTDLAKIVIYFKDP